MIAIQRHQATKMELIKKAGRPKRRSLGIAEILNHEARTGRKIDQGRGCEQHPVARTMVARPICVSKHAGVQTVDIRCLQQEPATGGQQSAGLRQNSARILHVLDQVEHQDQVKAAIAGKLFYGAAIVLMTIGASGRFGGGVQIDHLGEAYARVQLTHPGELPARTAAHIQDGQRGARDLAQQAPE